MAFVIVLKVRKFYWPTANGFSIQRENVSRLAGHVRSEDIVPLTHFISVYLTKVDAIFAFITWWVSVVSGVITKKEGICLGLQRHRHTQFGHSDVVFDLSIETSIETVQDAMLRRFLRLLLPRHWFSRG